jgi:hypothetical protein
MMSRQRIVIIGIVLAVVTAQICCAQSLPMPPKSCPMQSRCCRMLPAQPTDAIRPEAPQVAVVVVQPLILTDAPALPAALPLRLAPVREVPTRTIQLRI